jgi:cellulose synthase/poly-beta-1,6-N-acetylglucosamine synthase-like glycosyltransferase
MAMLIKLVFYFSIFSIFYIYLGYPLLVFILSRLRPKKVKKELFEPIVTIVTAAHNEEDVIGDTIKNKLALDYNRLKKEIIIVSDASEDRTDEIIKSFADKGVKYVRQEPRAGKTAALNKVVPLAQGDIIVFSDANSIFSKDALQSLVRNFADPDVGYVTGKMIYKSSQQSDIGDGCSAYMKYENMLRKWETQIGSIVGVDGGIDAVRKALYVPMRPDQLPDFVLPLNVVEQGSRVVYEPEAFLQESAHENASDEYSMRLRVALRAMWAIYDKHNLLNIKKYKIFAIQLWSHKVMRYACFIFLIPAYLSNMTLWHSGYFMKSFFLIQTSFYLAGVISLLDNRFLGMNRGIKFVKYFILINTASAQAFIKFLLGHRKVVWNPRK